MKRRPFVITCLSILLLAVSSDGILHAETELNLSDLQVAILRHDYVKAEAVSRELIAQDVSVPPRPDLRYYLAVSLVHTNEMDKAIEVLDSLLEEELPAGLRDKSYLALFDAYYLLGFYEQAQDVLTRLVKISPDSQMLSLVLLKKARAHLKMAEWEEARQELERIAQNFPHSLEIHTARQLLEEKNYFAVQVGAFIEQDRATILSTELQEKGEYAYILETKDRAERVFYRVRVGQLTKLDEAQQLRLKLSSQGYPARIYP